MAYQYVVRIYNFAVCELRTPDLNERPQLQDFTSFIL
jgi:hypothetical protein